MNSVEKSQTVEVLEQIKGWIEEARKIPRAGDYEPAPDPMASLLARARGEEVMQVEPSSAAAVAGVVGGQSKGDQSGGGHSSGGQSSEMGELLYRSLQKRALAGPLRAEVAARLARLLRGSESPELMAIWELLVFGGGDGSGHDGD